MNSGCYTTDQSNPDTRPLCPGTRLLHPGTRPLHPDTRPLHPTPDHSIPDHSTQVPDYSIQAPDPTLHRHQTRYQTTPLRHQTPLYTASECASPPVGSVRAEVWYTALCLRGSHSQCLEGVGARLAGTSHLHGVAGEGGTVGGGYCPRNQQGGGGTGDLQGEGLAGRARANISSSLELRPTKSLKVGRPQNRFRQGTCIAGNLCQTQFLWNPKGGLKI